MRHTGPSLELFPDEVSILVSKLPSLDNYMSITQHNGTPHIVQLTKRDWNALFNLKELIFNIHQTFGISVITLSLVDGFTSYPHIMLLRSRPFHQYVS